MIDRVAARTGKTKSKILREAIVEYVGAADAGAATERPYDKIKHLIGSWDSGGQQLSTRTGEKFAEALKREKANRDSDRRRSARRTHR